MLVFWLFFIIESVVLMALKGEALALDDTIYWGCILLNSFVLMGGIFGDNKRNPYLACCMGAGYLLRLAFLVWVQYFSHVLLLPNAGFDEYTFYYQAMGKLIRGTSVPSYSTLVAFQANFYGLSLLYSRYVNILYSMVAILFFSRTIELLKIQKKTYRLVILLACLLPNYALLSSLLLRESLNIMFLSMAGYFLVLWWNDGRIFHWGISICFALSSAWLHSGAIAFAVGEVVAFFCSNIEDKRRNFNLFNVKNIFICMIFLVIALLFMRLHESEITRQFNSIDSIADVTTSSHLRADGGSGYSSDIVANDSLGGFVLNTPFHMINFLFSPLPWQWRGFSDILAFIISPVFYFYVCLLVFYKHEYLKSIELLPLFVIIALGASVLFGWGVSNAGTALRHRDKFIFVFLTILALIKNEDEIKENLIHIH